MLHPETTVAAGVDRLTRCAAAHPEDRSACEGPPDAVRILDRDHVQVYGCVRHGAVLLASLRGGRVYPGTIGGAALAVCERAQGMRPFDFGDGGGVQLASHRTPFAGA